VKGPKPAVVFGKIGREGLRGSGNTAAMVKMVKSLAQAKYLASA
jgi:hypothetical protein